MYIYRLLWLGLYFVCFSLAAYQIEPMVGFYQFSGARTNAVYRIENTSPLPIAIEVEAKIRHLDEQNNESFSDTDDFMIFPPQAEVAGNGFQVFRVKFLGEPQASAMSYRLFFNQLPLESSEKENSVRLLFNFGTLAIVEPANGIAIPEVKMGSLGDNTPCLEITNTGNKSLNITTMVFNISNEALNKMLTWDDLKAMAPLRFLMPGQTIQIPLSEKIIKQNSEDITVSFKVI